jgi:hypothetical protein
METLYARMREDELTAQIRYHEDRLQEAERLAAYHRAAREAARADLTLLRQPAPARSRLTAA